MRVYIYLSNRYVVFVCLYGCVCSHWGGKADRLREGLDLEMMGEGVEQDDLQVSS